MGHRVRISYTKHEKRNKQNGKFSKLIEENIIYIILNVCLPFNVGIELETRILIRKCRKPCQLLDTF